MSGNLKHVVNMANSIIGVSILSMPYCFKEAGLVLGIILVLISGFMTKMTCMYLIKSAMVARRRSYELLAFQVFGLPGKLFMELCLICFLLGICISFHVVMGDLAPAIVAKYMEVQNSPSLRGTLLIGLVLLVILPLCLLRNIDSLASMSACSIGFYVFLNTVMFHMALPKLLDGSWITTVKLFQLDKALSVLPILSLALSCQSNVFEIYDSLPDPDVGKMQSVVSQAVNLCCALYIGVGFFGYVAFVNVGIAGNVILSFPTSGLTDGISLFFVISLAISFPLMLFPCRTSIHSLLFRRNTQISYDLVGNFMPEIRFKLISVCVLAFSLIIGILLPNIEVVLGLLGSTMGMLIALVLPSIFYIRVYTKVSVERLLAQCFLLFGIFMMIFGTILNLQAHDQKIVVTTAIPKIDLPVPVVNQAKQAVIPVPSVDVPAIRKEPAVPEPPAPVIEPVVKPAVNPKVEKVLETSKVEQKIEAIPKVVPDVIPETAKKKDNLHPDALQKEEKEHAEEGKKEDIEQKQEEILIHIEEQQKKQQEMLDILHELKEKSLKDDKNIEPNQKELAGVSNNASQVQPLSKKIGNLNSKIPVPIVKTLLNETVPKFHIRQKIRTVGEKPVRRQAVSAIPNRPQMVKVANQKKSHDEERRRRRDVGALVNSPPQKRVFHEDIHKLIDDSLNSVREVNIVFDSRHLLAESLKVRRRKKKYLDNEEYWDEM